MKMIIEVPSMEAFVAMKTELALLVVRTYGQYAVDREGNPIHTAPPALQGLLYSLNMAYREDM